MKLSRAPLVVPVAHLVSLLVLGMHNTLHLQLQPSFQGEQRREVSMATAAVTAAVYFAASRLASPFPSTSCCFSFLGDPSSCHPCSK